MMQPSDYNPFSPAVQRDPYPYYAVLRESAPVYRVEEAASYALSRGEDVVAALKNPAVFSSAAMNFAARSAKLMETVPEETRRAMSSRSIISADPPLHTRLRGLVSKAFTPRRVAELEPRIRAITREVLEAFPARGEVELIHALAAPLPVIVIAELLGVEPARRLDFKRWSDDVVSTAAAMRTGQDMTDIFRSHRELREYLESIIALRRKQPADDLISALVQGGEQEDLSLDEVAGFCRLLLIAGNETTTNLLSNGMLALLEHPEQLQWLREDFARIPNAVEEMLRYDSPVQTVFRRTTQEVEVSGVTIPAGADVLALIASANRDPRRFPDGERFDVRRVTQGQLSLGHGIHFCLGAPLARLEARVALEELLSTLGAIDYAPGQRGNVPYVKSFLVRGPTSLQLSVERK